MNFINPSITLFINKIYFLDYKCFQFQKVNVGVVLRLSIPDHFSPETCVAEICGLNYKNQVNLTKRKESTIWEGFFTFPRTLEVKYHYSLKKRYYVFRELNVEDKFERGICCQTIQRDILSLDSNILKDGDSQRGIAAHIIDILQKSECDETDFFELDNLKSRNSLKISDWNCAFYNLLDGHITNKMCLLLLHCIKKEFFTANLLDNVIAEKVWRYIVRVMSRGKADDFKKFRREIFQIYEISVQSVLSPLHIIRDLHSVLDLRTLEKVLISKPSFNNQCCPSFSSCLTTALKIILNQNEDIQIQNRIICIIFSCVSQDNMVDAFVNLSRLCNFDAVNKTREIEETSKRLVIEKLKNIISEKVKYFCLDAIVDIVSKVFESTRPELILHCEKEILGRITSTVCRPDTFFSEDLELVCKEKSLFQTLNQAELLLDAILKIPSSEKIRNSIKYVLMKFENKRYDFAKELLEKAYNVLIETVPGTSIQDKLKASFEEYDALSGMMSIHVGENVEKIFQRHVLIHPAIAFLQIHADVEILQESTVEFYCRLLKERLLAQTFLTNKDLIAKHCRNVNTR